MEIFTLQPNYDMGLDLLFPIVLVLFLVPVLKNTPWNSGGKNVFEQKMGNLAQSKNVSVEINLTLVR